jgi:DNA-directed RNA polymerase delta subunit
MTSERSKKSETEPSATTMPDDFWQLVQTARSRAQAEVEKKRAQVYKVFVTDEVRTGKRIPMPKSFWQAVEGDMNQPLSQPIAAAEDEQHPELASSHPSSAPAEMMAAQETVIETVTETTAELTLPARGCSFKEAAMIILSREARPMTAKEIVAVAINEGMLQSVGKTPDASLAGQIYTDIHRNKETSLFVIVGPRTYALKSGPATPPPSVTPRSILPGKFAWQGNEVALPPPPPAPTAAELITQNRKMSYKQAAFHLLEREKRPMTAKEIVAIALHENLIESSGKTPDATLAGQLYTEMQRAGERSPIILIGPRTYALAEWYKK